MTVGLQLFMQRPGETRSSVRGLFLCSKVCFFVAVSIPLVEGLRTDFHFFPVDLLDQKCTITTTHEADGSDCRSLLLRTFVL